MAPTHALQQIQTTRLRRLQKLDGVPAHESGVYLLYYTGVTPLYGPGTSYPALPPSRKTPIYIGQSVGHCQRRLRSHLKSITQACGLNPDDFSFKVIKPRVGQDTKTLERQLIGTFKPFWNCILTGFGSSPQGSNRPYEVYLFDVQHPGRSDYNSDPGVRRLTQADLAAAERRAYQSGRHDLLKELSNKEQSLRALDRRPLAVDDAT